MKHSESTYPECLWTKCDLVWHDEIGSALWFACSHGYLQKVLLSIPVANQLNQRLGNYLGYFPNVGSASKESPEYHFLQWAFYWWHRWTKLLCFQDSPAVLKMCLLSAAHNHLLKSQMDHCMIGIFHHSVWKVSNRKRNSTQLPLLSLSSMESSIWATIFCYSTMACFIYLILLISFYAANEKYWNLKTGDVF